MTNIPIIKITLIRFLTILDTIIYKPIKYLIVVQFQTTILYWDRAQGLDN